MSFQPVKFYQTGTFTVGNRLLAPEDPLGAGEHAAHQLAQLRAPRLPGMRRGARRALRDRRGDARHQQPADRGQRHRLPGGVLDAVSRDVLADSLDPFAVRQRGGGGHRHRGGAEGEGQVRRARDRAGRRRRHHRHRLRLPVGDVRAQRRRALHLLRQRGVHEHGRAALVGHAARGAHRDDSRRGRCAGQRVRPGQEPARDRDRARHPVRRHRHRLGAARPGGQGAPRDGVSRRALHPHLRALSARLGTRIQRHDPHRAPGEGNRAVPGVRSGARRGRERLQDPQAGCRSRNTSSRSAVSRTSSARRRASRSLRRSRRSRTATSASTDCSEAASS